ncbi:MAG: dihydroorotate dehydrogenase electron transfer subunit [bacterium]
MSTNHLLCKIISNQKISRSTYLMAIEAPPIASKCAPGQFVLLRGLIEGWPYLRRPFSIYSSDGDSAIEIIYRVVGRATHLMSKMGRGKVFNIIGPLGKCFSNPGEESVLVGVAGGIGFPPIAYACDYFVGVCSKVTLVVGAKTSVELLYPTNLIAKGIDIVALTEDGSKGMMGTAIDGLRQVIKNDSGSIRVIACGPREMLSAISSFCAEEKIGCEVSVEQVMGCGIGACLGCAVPSIDGGYFRACKEGAVIDSRQIDWKRWK